MNGGKFIVGERKEIEKRLPATTSLEQQTFLNDRKIDGELYSLFLEYSIGVKDKGTVVLKSKLPTQKIICERLGIKSPKTYRAHRDYLIEQGYIIEEDDAYIMTLNDENYFPIPLKTVMFLGDVLKERVIKAYIYLGQRWKWKGDQYVFTIEELCKHTGLDSTVPRDNTTINNILLCLKKLGLIDYKDEYIRTDSGTPRLVKRLIMFKISIEG